MIIVNKVVHSSLLIVVFAIVAYAGVALFSGGADVWAAIRSVSLTTWVIILALSLGNYALRYWRWHLYISNQSPITLTHKQHFAIYIAGFSLTMTPGKAGEAMRSLYLKQHGISHQRSISALFVERIIDLIAILLMAGMGISFLHNDQSWLAGAITIAIILSGITVVKMPKKWVLESALVKKLPVKMYNMLVFVESMLESANDLLSVRFLVVGLLIGLVAWIFEGYGLYLVMHEYTQGQSTIPLAIAIYGMAVLLGALSFMPGGLGGTEATMIFLLAKAGFDHPSAVAITFICRLVTLWFAMILGVITLFLLPFLGLKPYVKES